MRYFKIKWFKNEKFGETIERKTEIRTTGDAQSALQIWMKINGNLKENTIISIQEYKKDLETKIGEPIVPSDENTIVPTGLKEEK